MTESDNDIGCENDEQMAFVVLLENYKVLFDKKQTPAIISAKGKAAFELANAYSKNINKTIETKQIMKKFNNMKTKIKRVVDKKQTSNKNLVLTDWQKIFLSLWKEVDKSILNRVPVTSPCTRSNKTPPKVHEKKMKLNEEEGDEFKYKNIEELQRLCLIHQIEAARAQEAAAKEMLIYYENKNKTNVNFEEIDFIDTSVKIKEELEEKMLI